MTKRSILASVASVAFAVATLGCAKKAPPARRDGGPATTAAAVATLPDAGVTCDPDEPVVADAEGLAFFSKLSGHLKIELTEAPQKIDPALENLKAPKTARMKSVKLDISQYIHGDFVPVTPEQLDQIVFRGSRLVLRSLGGSLDHTQADCIYTVRDVVHAIEETELQTRADSEWFDGIDVHHIFFEGLTANTTHGWDVSWGS